MEIDSKAESSAELPKDRFSLELEFATTHSPIPIIGQVQSLASPAYLHYIATITTNEGKSLLLCPRFKAFLRYLHKTWTRPEYARFIIYPNALYFLEVMINNEAFCRELGQVPFRNFCHQQQYYAWQNRFATLYGTGVKKVVEAADTEDGS
eukprot:scaffold982_cov139-Cylindrotheca_fusiformis.AAC.22